MIHLTTAFRQHLFDDQVNYLNYADITLASGTVLRLTNTELWSGGFETDDAVGEDDSFTSLGSAVIGSAAIIINNIDEKYSEYDFTDAKVILYTGMQLPNGSSTRLEKIQKGVYTVDEPEYNGGTIKLSLLDNMEKFDESYSKSTLVYPATLSSIVRDACSVCGVTLGTASFPNSSTIVSSRPDDESTTFRDVIGWAAALAGCFARVNRFGYLELKWFDTNTLAEAQKGIDGGIFDGATPYATGASVYGGIFKPWDSGDTANDGDFADDNGVHYISRLTSQNVSVDDSVITGVEIIVRTDTSESQTEKTFSRGTTGYTIRIESNPFLTEENADSIAERLGNLLIGLKFRKLNVSHASDPSIEAGDIAIVFDRKGRAYPILVTRTSFSPDGYHETVCGAESPSFNSSTRYSSATKDYVEIRKAIRHEKASRELALEQLSNMLAESPGLYSTIEKADSGNVYYLHDAPDLADSKIVWKMTAEAWGVSTDGGKTWNGGMMVNGDVITRILTATGINADWINTGQLSVKKDGKEVLFVDVDTGTVRIVADTFSMSSGETIQSIVDNAIEESVQTFLGTGAPSISGYPASSWSTTSTKEKHIGALYYDTQTGHIYRYTHKVGAVRIKFDSQSKSEADRYDYVRVLYSKDGKLYRTQDVGGASFPDMVVPSADFYVYWHSDSSSTGWGFKIDSVTSEMSSEAGENDTEVSSLPISDYTTVTDATTVQTKTHPYDNNESYMWLVKTGLSLGATTYTWTELSGVKTYAQEEQPAVAAEGDVWIDTDDGNLFYRYTNGKWTEYRDAAIEQALQDAKEYADQVVGTATDSVVDTYYGNGVPTNSNYPRSSWKSVELNSHIGDMYYDLSTGRAYRFVSTSGGVVLSFDSQSKTESANFDWVIVYYNKDGQLYSTEKRGGTSFEDLFVPSADFYVYWRSDSSNTGWGFKISGVTTASKDSDGFIETKTSTLPISDYTTVTDATTVETDSHPYTDGESKMWLVNTGLTLPSTSYQWSEISDTRIAQAIKDAGDAQATADGKIKTFAQTAEPTDGMSVGDLWIDTDDNNKLYRYSGSSWVAYRDGQIAENLQTAKDYADDAAEKAAKAAVDAQTQTDIFNKLTNSGKLKGLYMKDGQLYISATYILSGILKLGGANNGNGTLEIYNSSGTRIGLFNNSGINLGSGKFVADTSGNVTAKNITAYGSFICYENN